MRSQIFLAGYMSKKAEIKSGTEQAQGKPNGVQRIDGNAAVSSNLSEGIALPAEARVKPHPNQVTLPQTVTQGKANVGVQSPTGNAGLPLAFNASPPAKGPAPIETPPAAPAVVNASPPREISPSAGLTSMNSVLTAKSTGAAQQLAGMNPAAIQPTNRRV